MSVVEKHLTCSIMKSHKTTFYLLSLLTVGTTLGLAQEGERKGPPGGGNRLAEFLKRADVNNDGKISKEDYGSIAPPWMPIATGTWTKPRSRPRPKKWVIECAAAAKAPAVIAKGIKAGSAVHPKGTHPSRRVTGQSHPKVHAVQKAAPPGAQEAQVAQAEHPRWTRSLAAWMPTVTAR
jgi:hypothetical protein